MSLLLETPADDLTGRAEDRDFFPATVTVTRTSEADFKSRQLIVWIDGARVATLMWGDSVTMELPPGRHSVRVSNTLVWKTIDFDLQTGEQVFFEAINHRAGYPHHAGAARCRPALRHPEADVA